jgi:hypothetical protein
MEGHWASREWCLIWNRKSLPTTYGVPVYGVYGVLSFSETLCNRIVIVGASTNNCTPYTRYINTYDSISCRENSNYAVEIDWNSGAEDVVSRELFFRQPRAFYSIGVNNAALNTFATVGRPRGERRLKFARAKVRKR